MFLHWLEFNTVIEQLLHFNLLAFLILSACNQTDVSAAPVCVYLNTRVCNMCLSVFTVMVQQGDTGEHTHSHTLTHTASSLHTHAVPKGDVFNSLIMEGSRGVKFNAREKERLHWGERHPLTQTCPRPCSERSTSRAPGLLVKTPKWASLSCLR